MESIKVGTKSTIVVKIIRAMDFKKYKHQKRGARVHYQKAVRMWHAPYPVKTGDTRQ